MRQSRPRKSETPNSLDPVERFYESPRNYDEAKDTHMTEVITRPSKGATKAPARAKAAPAPVELEIDEASLAASRAMQFVSVLMSAIVEDEDNRSLGDATALFVQVETNVSCLAYGDTNDEPVPVKKEDVDRVTTMLEAALNTMEATVDSLPPGTALVAATLGRQALELLGRISDALEASPATLGPLKALDTYAGVRPFSDRPVPPIRRVEEELDENDGGFDLHAEYLHAEVRGFAHDLTLRAHQVQKINTRLQGITVISAILMTQGEGGMEFSEWMSGGLVDAMHCLATDSMSDFEQINNCAKKQKGAA